MLGPEILAVFANSQIFQDHPKLNRISTKSYLTGVHTPQRELTTMSATSTTTPRETEQDRLLRRLEGNNNDSNSSHVPLTGAKVKFFLDEN